jgi:hypothetical protein
MGNNRRMEEPRPEENVKLSLHLTEHFALNIAGRRGRGVGIQHRVKGSCNIVIEYFCAR